MVIYLLFFFRNQSYTFGTVTNHNQSIGFSMSDQAVNVLFSVHSDLGWGTYNRLRGLFTQIDTCTLLTEVALACEPE